MFRLFGRGPGLAMYATRSAQPDGNKRSRPDVTVPGAAVGAGHKVFHRDAAAMCCGVPR